MKTMSFYEISIRFIKSYFDGITVEVGQTWRDPEIDTFNLDFVIAEIDKNRVYLRSSSFVRTNKSIRHLKTFYDFVK
jgi:hypothetical protein